MVPTGGRDTRSSSIPVWSAASVRSTLGTSCSQAWRHRLRGARPRPQRCASCVRAGVLVLRCSRRRAAGSVGGGLVAHGLGRGIRPADGDGSRRLLRRQRRRPASRVERQGRWKQGRATILLASVLAEGGDDGCAWRQGAQGVDDGAVGPVRGWSSHHGSSSLTSPAAPTAGLDSMTPFFNSNFSDNTPGLSTYRRYLATEGRLLLSSTSVLMLPV